MQTLGTPPPASRRKNLAEYLRRAFLYRWNLLAFIGGTAGAILSPWPDAVLPLVAAAETIYLAALVSAPKFRSAVDAQLYQEERQPQAAESQRTLQEILAGLPPESRRRFDDLRQRCLDMRAIADGVRGGARRQPEPAADLSTQALDRLLWVFLRLLVSQRALAAFLSRTDPKEIHTRLEEARAKVAALSEDDRVRRSLEDSVKAQELRLENYRTAEKNAEFVRVELDRIEAKIQALTEAAVNRQDTEFLSSQIDSVAASMQSTENAISELNQLTGIVDEMQEPPAILAGGGRA